MGQALSRYGHFSAVLRTVRLYGFASWVYLALVAAFRPHRLTLQIVHLLRSDTFGALCFVGSAIASLLLSRFGDGDQRMKSAFKLDTLTTVWLWAASGWMYIALNSLTHPGTLGRHLTHFASWPKEGDFGIACFIVSAFAYFLRDTRRSVTRSPGSIAPFGTPRPSDSRGRPTRSES
jgi:hypothetical protein